MTFRVTENPETHNSGLHVQKSKGISSSIWKENLKNKNEILKTVLYKEPEGKHQFKKI